MITIRHQLLVVLPVLAATHSAAAQTTITFDELPSDTTVRNQYAAKGVHFGDHTISTHPTPHSGKNVLYSVSPSAEVFEFPPITMTFDSGQSSVRLFAGTTG